MEKNDNFVKESAPQEQGFASSSRLKLDLSKIEDLTLQADPSKEMDNPPGAQEAGEIESKENNIPKEDTSIETDPSPEEPGALPDGQTDPKPKPEPDDQEVEITQEKVASALSSFTTANFGYEMKPDESKDVGAFLNAFKEKVVKDSTKVDSDTYAQVKEVVLKDIGISQDYADRATGRYYGVDVGALENYKDFSKFLDKDITTMDDKDAYLVFFNHHTSKNLSESDAEHYATQDLARADKAELLANRVENLSDFVKKEVDSIENKYKEAVYKERIHAESIQKEQDKLLSGKRIGGKTYSDEEIMSFRSARAKKTEDYKTPSGTVIKVTPYKKKELEMDAESKLRYEMDFWLSNEKIKKENSEEIEDQKNKGDFMEFLNSKTTKKAKVIAERSNKNSISVPDVKPVDSAGTLKFNPSAFELPEDQLAR